MLSTALALFIAGILTIFLPCILPLVPIVLGVSIAGRSKWRPLLAIAGMVVSFVFFTFLLLVVLRQFVELADYIRIGTYYVLLLFGLGFLFHDRLTLYAGAVAGAFFFWEKGWWSVAGAAVLGVLAMYAGGKLASKLQQLGTDIQISTTHTLGRDSPITAFIIGLTLGLVWVPCAGPALGLALTLVRDEPGIRAFALLFTYALGTSVPLLLIGYGGQAAVHSVRAITPYTGRIKQVAGALLIISAIAFRLDLFQALQTKLIDAFGYGNFALELEDKLFQEKEAEVADVAKEGEDSSASSATSASSPSTKAMKLPKLPKLIRAPEFTGLGPWHNSEPFTLQSLRGKVVLVDFWTYSCINCIRTLPYIEGYWNKFKGTDKFVLLGVHTPEFVFEKSQKNVAAAIKKHGLTYPTAQDNDFGTWGAFANRYWPAKYLIDAEGYIRYTHFGEGAYEETDLAIQSLLSEIGVNLSGQRTVDSGQRQGGYRDVTRETYVGTRSWSFFGNQQGDPNDAVITYTKPASLELHHYYLDGQWQLPDEEHQVLRSDKGSIFIRFLGGEINLVLGLENEEQPVQAEVWMEGKMVKAFTVTENDLYELFKGDYGEHVLELRLKGSGVQAYAFTFGG